MAGHRHNIITQSMFYEKIVLYEIIGGTNVALSHLGYNPINYFREEVMFSSMFVCQTTVCLCVCLYQHNIPVSA
jgi:hypothetical protein